MRNPHPSIESLRTRNRSRTRKNWAKAEQFLTEVEKIHGNATSWEMRVRLERGEVTLAELGRR